MKGALPLPEEEFALFQKLLIEESGLCFDEDNRYYLHTALWERIQKRGCDSYRNYYNLLKFYPEGRLEIKELLDLVTVGETYFFRDDPHFETLMKFVLPEIIQKKIYSASRSIRMWSAGCSSGDEPYSLAIAVLEILPFYENWDVSILGTDINKNALAKAKEAVCGRKSVSNLPAGFLDKYFRKNDKNYLLNDEVKKLVNFQYHNLARDPFTSENMRNLDIIFCRNVTIYFDPQTTKKVIDNFYDCLAPDGYCFLGHAEAMWQITDKFEAVNFPRAFIYKKSLRPVKTETAQPFIGVPEIKLEEFPETKSPEMPSADKKETPKAKNQLRVYFDKATALANQAKYKEAISELKKIIEADNLHVEAYYLLGVLSYKTGDFQEAETQFRRVIYINPDIVIAYFNLGKMYLYQKKFNKAAREFNNAIRALEKKPKEEQVKFSEGFSVELLLRACKKTLDEIKIRR